MDEYIEKSTVLAIIGKHWRSKIYADDAIQAALDEIGYHVPSADVQPVRHGRWENINDLECFKCSCCGEYANQPWGKDGAIMFSYCPNCGCKMDGGDTSERQTMAFQSQND